jgi:DNA-binding GntR family transcriptional regulator
VRQGTGEPLYLAVFNRIRAALQTRRWEVGSSLPSEAELSRQFAVSRITIRHALSLLESEGYIRKARARRPVVVATAPQRRGWTVESLEDIVAMVGDARLDVKTWREEHSPDAALFGLDHGTRLHCLRSILVRDGKPYARSIVYFPPAIGSRLSRSVFDDTVVFRVLQREIGVRIEDVQLTIWAESASPEDAASLRCEVGAALLVMQLLYWREGGDLIEVAYSRSLASEVRLSTHLTTGPSRP